MTNKPLTIIFLFHKAEIKIFLARMQDTGLSDIPSGNSGMEVGSRDEG